MANPRSLINSSASMNRKNGRAEGSMLSPMWYLARTLADVALAIQKTIYNLGNLAASRRVTSKPSRASAVAE